MTVTPSGTFGYRIPIPVPPGRAGLEPEIALVHNGSGQSTELGVAWALEGISSVHRCPRINATDGAPAPVDHTEADRFCLDDQYLIAIGSDGGVVEYRTEVDGHARVRRFETGNWEVVTKNGRRMLYIHAVRGDGDAIDAWMLSVVEDRAGNRMRFYYSQPQCPTGPGGDPNCAARETFLTHITYGGHGLLQIGTRAATRRVVFNYEERRLKQAGYSFGTPKQRRRRLASIETFVEDEPVRTFRIEYGETDARVDHLTGV
jgi:hypothetical protein